MKKTWFAFVLLAGSALFIVGCAARYPARYYQPGFSPGYSRYDRHHHFDRREDGDRRDYRREDHWRDERRERD